VLLPVAATLPSASIAIPEEPGRARSATTSDPGPRPVARARRLRPGCRHGPLPPHLRGHDGGDRYQREVKEPVGASKRYRSTAGSMLVYLPTIIQRTRARQQRGWRFTSVASVGRRGLGYPTARPDSAGSCCITCGATKLQQAISSTTPKTAERVAPTSASWPLTDAGIAPARFDSARRVPVTLFEEARRLSARLAQFPSDQDIRVAALN